MSILPHSLRVPSISRRTWNSSVKDPAMANTRAPACRSSLARNSTLLCLRAQIASAAPLSASALATACPTCPSPLTPVTTATLPSRLAGMSFNPMSALSRARCYADECPSSEKRETASEPAFGSSGARFQGGITTRAASSQGNQASRVTSAQNIKGLAASKKRPNASKEGTACRLIEICSVSPPGDRR